MANKAKKLETLDERLNNYIDTNGKWNNFRMEILAPLMRDEHGNQDTLNSNNRNNCPSSGQRTNFPTLDEPVDTNKRDYTIDRVYPESMCIGSKNHLSFIATMYHNEMLHNATLSTTNNNVLTRFSTISNHFDRAYNEKTFYSMVRPIDNNWNSNKNKNNNNNDNNNTNNNKNNENNNEKNINDTIRKSLWKCGIAFPFTHDITENQLKWVKDPRQLYQWTEITVTNVNGQNRTSVGKPIDNEERWRKIFSPLLYYKWVVPNSVLNTWTFSIDPNIAHTLNWYRFYLNYVAKYRETITKYATELQRQHDLTRKKTALTEAFVKRNAEIKRTLRLKLTSLPRGGTRNINYERYIVALNKLYDEFVKEI